jgi:ABC-type microcin C transport system duplicated ATPase subunit YejF
VRALSHKVIVMKVMSSSAESLFRNPRQKYTRELMKAAFGESSGTAA